MSAYLRVLLTASLIKGCGCYFKKLLQSGIFPSVWISEGDCILRGSLLLCNKPSQNSIVVCNNSHLFCSRIYKLGRSWQRLWQDCGRAWLISTPHGISWDACQWVGGRAEVGGGGLSTFKMVHLHGCLKASPQTGWAPLKHDGWVLRASTPREQGNSWNVYDQASKVTWLPFDFSHWWGPILFQIEGRELCLWVTWWQGSSRPCWVKHIVVTIFEQYNLSQTWFQNLLLNLQFVVQFIYSSLC